MDKYTKEDILEQAIEQNVSFVRLQFTDIFGVLKNVSITVGQLEKALNGELIFDGSSIEGFVRIEESDMYLKPDLSTFIILPWRPKEGAVARMICDVYNADHTPYSGCPRVNLKRVLAEAAEMGYTVNVGPEAEFFLFTLDDNGNPTTNTQDNAGYFDLTPVDFGETARRDMVLTLQDMGCEVEGSHHELAPGQHEIDFAYDDALNTADKIVTFKFVVRTIAQRHGLHATFMPKPITGMAGSGMHINISLFKDGNNIFYDSKEPRQLSQVARFFIGGVLEHAPAYTAVTNPTVNSYKRLLSGYEAPIHVAWSEKNRSPLIRIPANRGRETRIELRSPDPTCNPYLALAAIIKSGLDGIKNKIAPPEPINMNVYDLESKDLERLGIKRLPFDLKDALDKLAADKLISGALGEHICRRFVEAKRIELNNYCMEVHPWELAEYLNKF
ncbi:MAG: type I glutamate--ammonia ligase [Desulfitobacteriaceae bacterium]|nr:type I glutamate--ammonia ligase [Desulfitobacteriaceae bacterium]